MENKDNLLCEKMMLCRLHTYMKIYTYLMYIYRHTLEMHTTHNKTDSFAQVQKFYMLRSTF